MIKPEDLRDLAEIFNTFERQPHKPLLSKIFEDEAARREVKPQFKPCDVCCEPQDCVDLGCYAKEGNAADAINPEEMIARLRLAPNHGMGTIDDQLWVLGNGPKLADHIEKLTREVARRIEQLERAEARASGLSVRVADLKDPNRWPSWILDLKSRVAQLRILLERANTYVPPTYTLRAEIHDALSKDTNG